MSAETYELTREVSRIQQELLSRASQETDFSPLVEIERRRAAAKSASLPESRATLLDTKKQPIFLGPESTGLEAEVKLGMSQVPTSLVNLLDPAENPLVIISVQYVGPPGGGGNLIKRVRISSYVEGYSAVAVSTVELRRGANAVSVSQLPTFFPAKLDTVQELTRASLNVTVEHLDDSKLELQTTANIWLLPRTAAVLEMKDPSTGKWKDLYRYLTAYVTPNAPEVMSFLTDAKKHAPGGSFVGYQPPKAGVTDQVKAIYDALKSRGTSYVNSLTAFANPEALTSQRVRLPSESLKDTNANCIDGVVLFASLLEAISLNPALMLVSGHAFLGWRSWPDGDWKYLETTLIGSGSFDEACAKGEEIARQFGSLAQSFPLDEARTKYHITPIT